LLEPKTEPVKLVHLLFQFLNLSIPLRTLSKVLLSSHLSNYTALILVPTRELALQVSSVVKDLGKYLKVESVVSTGGTSIREDIIRLHNPVHVIVGTDST